MGRGSAGGGGSAGLCLVVAAAAAAGASLVIGIAAIGGTSQSSTSASVFTVVELAARSCLITGPVAGLNPAQAANADTIVSVSTASSNDNMLVARIALMTALTESGLRNLDYGDKDSLGLFQQRPSQGWGTPAQLMDPKYATEAFVHALLGLPGWQHMAPWIAAQAVQHSANTSGSRYEHNWKAAGRILGRVAINGNRSGACGQGGGGLATRGGHGLPRGYVIPSGTPPEHAKVVRFALAQLGKPYVWAASGPGSYDCSGLTLAAWATVGVELVHAASIQQTEGSAVTVVNLSPGDLVLVPGSDSPGPGLAGHVGIYLGDGLVISAIDPQYGVAVQTWSTFVSGGLIALRDPAPGR